MACGIAHVEHVALAAGERLQCARIDVGGDHARSGARESFGAGASDARSRRGDHRGLAGESLRFHRLLVQFRNRSARARRRSSLTSKHRRWRWRHSSYEQTSSHTGQSLPHIRRFGPKASSR